MNKDIITIKNNSGQDEEVELILSYNKNNKQYIVYKNSNEEIFASYFLGDSDNLYNDLTEEEFNMLEALLIKGSDVYDK